jgi:hypothetical protein
MMQTIVQAISYVLSSKEKAIMKVLALKVNLLKYFKRKIKN